MDEQQDDIPMMDAPEPTSNLSASAQRFSIVDVLGGDRSGAGKDAGIPPADPMHSDLHEHDECKVLQRLQELYPHTDIQKLPRFWSKSDRWTPPSVQNNNGGVTQIPVLELSSDLLRVTKRKGNSQNSKDAAAVRANRSIPRSCIVYYFEITVVSKGLDGFMGIGLSEKSVSLNRLPGWDQTSYGYHGDDGNFFASSGKGVEYGPTFTTGDVIGCGLNFVTREIFFTKNGQHLGVANRQQPIPLCSELYPTIGMQTADEMIDANFGQKPFLFDIHAEIEAAERATLENVSKIELPAEKVLWMNNLLSNWMSHEGYSRALDALNRATGGTKLEPVAALAKSDSQGSTATSASKDSQSPAAAAEKTADNIVRSMIGLFGGEGSGGRRSVVRSVQEALHEEMEQRRAVVRMIKKGQLADAFERIEQLYPNLLESNRQLALLLKIQHFVEMLRAISKELPPLPQEQEQLNPRPNFSHSPSPRPSSSRGGKRSASAVDDDYAMAGTSTDDASLNQHNPVKRRSSDEDCRRQSPRPKQQQNGNAAAPPPQQQQQEIQEEFMEIGEESQDGQAMMTMGDPVVANGQSTNGCGSSSLLVGTPPTSTTIIDEPVPEICETGTDGMCMEMGDEQEEPDCGGFANAEEQSQFERYAVLLEYGQQISQFSLKLDAEDGQGIQSCMALRQRMNDAFSLICYRDPSQSGHAYLLEQTQRDMVAKALNAAILESHGKEGSSPLDRCLRRARFIRDQALFCSASAVFADANRLLFGENPAASPNHSGAEMNEKLVAENSQAKQTGQVKPSSRMIRQMEAQKKEM